MIKVIVGLYFICMDYDILSFFLAMLRENLSSWYLTRSNTNQVVQPQKMASGLKYWISEEEELYYVVKTKTKISSTVIAQLICTFVFAYAKSFS